MTAYIHKLTGRRLFLEEAAPLNNLPLFRDGDSYVRVGMEMVQRENAPAEIALHPIPERSPQFYQGFRNVPRAYWGMVPR